MLGIEWQKIWRNKFMVIVLIAVMLVPSLYALGFLKSMWDPYGEIKNLPVAVINEDQSVKYNGKTLAVGEQLKHNLENSNTMKFSFPSQKVANKGLSDGKYYMVLTIPKSFSENATTLLDEHPKKMSLHYSTSLGHSFIAGQLSKTGAESIARTISKQITQNYAEAMFQQMQALGGGFSTAAKGNQQLAAGSQKIQSGNDKIATNLQVLATSSLKFSDGSNTLTQGLGQYFSGVSQAQKGSAKIATGLNKLSEKMPSLNTGVSQLYTGSTNLESGLNQYTTGIDKVNNGASALNQGAQKLVTGSTAVNSSVEKLSHGSNDLNTGVIQYTDGTTTAFKASEKISSGLTQMNSALNDAGSKNKIQQLQAGLTSFKTGLDQLKAAVNSSSNNQHAGEINQLTSSMASLAGNITTINQYMTGTQAKLNTVAKEQHLSDQQTTAISNAILPTGGVTSALKEATNNLSNLQTRLQTLGTADENSKQVQNGVNRLVDSYGTGAETTTVYGGINSLIGSVQQAGDRTNKLATGATQLTTGLSQLDQKSKQLVNGATQLTNGLTQLNANMPTLTNGINALATGSSQLNTGTKALSSNGKQLNTGSQKLTNGLSSLNTNMPVMHSAISQLASGSNQATAGLGQLTNHSNQLLSGSQKLTQGATQLSDGSNKLASGSQKLGDGISQVADGNSLLANKLRQAGGKVSATKATPQTYEQLANPTTTKHSEKDTVPNNGTGMAPYILSLSLFIGAVSFNLMYDLVTPLKYPKKVMSWWASKMAVVYPFAFLQGALMYLVSVVIVGLKPVNYATTFGIIIMTSFAFVTIVTALNLWFGKVGSFLTMLLMIVQLGGSAGTYPIELSNHFFEVVHPYLPMTYSVSALRQSLMIGHSATADVLVLLGMFVVFTLIIISFYMMKKRKLKKINYAHS
ncbi:YhgE/Pip domain-containing protein [Leuconostoc carnosum]|uniref:YhgE/Pip domain-containing protein n=1 Tax=Leuconostoc carnosum TaxID=1252 RepID=UPI00123BBB2A|nr:YhgE/Pip domain-containing protein [Leuconostoc carnosum]KAA8380533.1 YhgE/Pip domain-containing protein [Leuconostoc carnosum]